MGKPESTSSGGKSVKQLMSSIRTAIEANGVLRPQADAAPAEPETAVQAPRPVVAPVKVAATGGPVNVRAVVHPAPVLKREQPEPVEPQPESDNSQSEHISANSYRYRHSLGGSPTHMSLRNRLASLKSRTKADSRKTFASLLGGDVREEEARARYDETAAQAQLDHMDPHQQAHLNDEYYVPDNVDEAGGLRSSVSEEVFMDEFVGAELASGSVAYSPDYHELPPETAGQEFVDLQLAEQQTPNHVPQIEEAVEPALVEQPHDTADTVADNGLADEEVVAPCAAETVQEEEDAEPELPLQEMIQQLIEPEMVKWFNDHMPDHVARSMPDEAAFIAMIRPLIEEWLGDNLEPIVEHAVREEIARITGLQGPGKQR